MIRTKYLKISLFIMLGFIMLSFIDKNNKQVDITTVQNKITTEEYVKPIVVSEIALRELQDDWTFLLDNDLSNWEKWLGVPHSTTGLPGSSDNVTNGSGTAIGLNNDSRNVFSVVDMNGEKVLKVSGEIYGGLTTKEEYGNYHFSLQFKWGEKKWEPRLNAKRDSGILYHCKGPHGAFWDTWKASLEFQVQETDCGDFISLAGVKGSIPAEKINNSYKFKPKETPVQTGRVIRSEDREKPNGEWNTLEVISIGDRSIHLVNGYLVNAVQDARFNNASVIKGQLQIQSEGAEMYYKDIKIKSATDFPEVHLNTLGWESQGTGDASALIGKVVALKKSGGNSKWVMMDANTGDSQLIASGASVSESALFFVEEHPNGGIGLKAKSNNKYVQVQGNDADKPIRAFGNAMGTWEQFSWKSKGEGKTALKSTFIGDWVQASWLTDNSVLYPKGAADGDWETFDFVVVEGDVLSNDQGNEALVKKFKVYPNPAKELISITGLTENAVIEVVDLLGRKAIVTEKLNSQLRQLDISGLPQGVYMISVGGVSETFVKN